MHTVLEKLEDCPYQPFIFFSLSLWSVYLCWLNAISIEEEKIKFTCSETIGAVFLRQTDKLSWLVDSLSIVPL